MSQLFFPRTSKPALYPIIPSAITARMSYISSLAVVIIGNAGCQARNGAIYFCAGATGLPRSGLVRIGINSGLATVVSSTQFDYPDYVTAANGAAWVLNTYGGTANHPILVRVS